MNTEQIRQMQEMAGIMIAREAPTTIAIPESELDDILEEFEEIDEMPMQGSGPNRQHEPINGLEGPFKAKNGRVYYYDPTEGKAYDPDTDLYMSDDEYIAMSENEADDKFAGQPDRIGDDDRFEPTSRKDIIASVIKYGPDSQELYHISEQDLDALIDAGKVEDVVKAHWYNAQEELAQMMTDAHAEFGMTEEVVGDLQNGYDEHHETTKDYNDYFPSGADAPASDKAGPASAKQGDSPLQKKTFPSDIHEELVYKYRNFITEDSNNSPLDEYT